MKTYTIHKGCHYSNFFPTLHFISNEMEFARSLQFTNSCKYHIDEASCVNKLFGFCFGFGVHQDSVRFGWTYDTTQSKFVIWRYTYTEGVLVKHQMAWIEPNEYHDYKIKLIRKKTNSTIYRHAYDVKFFIDNKPYYVTTIQSNKLILWTLGPYFGGNTKAPHTMKILEA